MENKIKIVDSIMGSGKTSWAIQYMNEADGNQKFIYITPFLSEVQRIKSAVKNHVFYEPVNKGKGKLDSLKKLILNEKNIVSTHALFQTADDEMMELIRASNYTLILDEVMSVVEEYPLNNDDFKLLIDNEMIYIDKHDGTVHWNDESKYQDTKYDELKMVCKTENLIYFENTILFWTFPVEVFKSFKQVYVLTYLFEAQEQRYYYDMHQLNYSYKAVARTVDGVYTLVNHEEKDPYNKEQIKSLINIYEGNLNSIGDNPNSLSLSWYGKNALLLKKMKKNISTYFKNNTRTSSQLNMWTCYKVYRGELKDKGYSGTSKRPCFVAHNARATNDYQHKQALAYVISRFMKPHKYKFFRSKGIEVNQDLWALSELLQWIWRSRIRTGKPVNLYIPSKRMRTILKDYLDSDK
ncbi:hypothetical protein [Priestia flexa]|uniref:hypothetical protein n=1 Tax=Priestia flexa TaxID=86664 RepID=UPI002491F171|nr:hypothetical protein [Priestia flexa]